ncbi:MAG TPA: alpha/beta fold hydrolase [Chryseosolibacter sp.]|nr:alpha/beta fold hydrolase [Chryseosolibacter sp.]
MLRIILLVAFNLPLYFTAMAQNPDLFERAHYTSEGDTLPYRLLKPFETQQQTKYPLVVFLHGAGERGNDNEVQIKHISALFLDEQNRKNYPAFVLAPQCPRGHVWSSFRRDGQQVRLKNLASRPAQLLLRLMDEILNELPIDRERIYIVGLSMGGFGTWDLIARHPNKFAAAVAVCGGGAAGTAPSIKHIPVWAFHGGLDKVVLPRESRSMIQALRDAGGSPGYTEYPHVEHNSWVNAFKEPELLPWLFDKRLTNIQQ